MSEIRELAMRALAVADQFEVSRIAREGVCFLDESDLINMAAFLLREGVANDWSPADQAPTDGTIIRVRQETAMRFLAYKPNSDQARNGEKGRWQRIGDYGGWDNCSAPNGDWQVFDKPRRPKTAELSRLRDLVREMREAMRDTSIPVSEEAFKKHMWAAQCHYGITSFDACPNCQRQLRMIRAIAKADAYLKESGEPAKYGCHGIKASVYETCFLDTKDAEDCHLGGNSGLTDKATCPHWRPIK